MKLSDSDIGFAALVLRVSVGFTFLFAGLNKLMSYSSMTDAIIGGFSETWLPFFLVKAIAYPLPFIEFGAGLLAILGLFTRQVFYVLGLLILFLNFGLLVQANYETAASNLMYVILIAANIILLNYNRFSLDAAFRGKKENVA